jgi:hypothetical protein
MMDRKDRGHIVAEHNGQCFRFNDLVHICEGTEPGVRAKKTEFLKAWFKGVDAKKDKFICRLVIGYSRGPFPRFSKGSVFKVKVLTLTLTITLSQILTLTLSGLVLTGFIAFFPRSFLRVLRQCEDVLQLTTDAKHAENYVEKKHKASQDKTTHNRNHGRRNCWDRLKPASQER